MSSPGNENEEPSSTSATLDNGVGGNGELHRAAESPPRPPAKRRLETAVIEISDTESDDSDVCAVNSYQASADEVKRIRGEADYSSSSSSDYSSDSESPYEDDSILLEDEHPNGRPVRAQLNPRANRMDDPKFNSALKSEEFIDRLSTNWKDSKDHKCNEATFTCEPFKVCLLHKLLDNPEIINNIVDDMNTLDWARKKMDLYEFHQTADLASLTWQRSIRGIYELLKTDVMSWVSKVTGLELRSVSASCSLYGPGDHLLPHDDLLADRRVAFILYLAPWRPAPHKEGEDSSQGWLPSMGGALELLARDEAGPTQVVREIHPRNNMLAFFQVGSDSFHQVGEVLSLELPRLSINGWFHGPLAAAPAPEPEPAPPSGGRPHGDVVLLGQWLEATYMAPRARAALQAHMERRSAASLQRVLQPARYEQLLAALGAPDVPWQAAGPRHRRRYALAPDAWLDAQPAEHPVRALRQLLGSAAFCRMLAECTDLQLQAVERLELQRWAPGDFSLLPPAKWYAHARLEAVLYLGGCAGATLYLAPEEPDAAAAALASVPAVANSLSLVYCDAGAASFTKYRSRLAAARSRRDQPFYIVLCVYRE